MVSFQKAFWSKIAVAGHGTRYLFRLTFSRIISIFAILLSPCLFAKRIEKKNSHNSDDSLPISCLSSASQQCVLPVSVTVFVKFSKLSVNPKLSEVVAFITRTWTRLSTTGLSGVEKVSRVHSTGKSLDRLSTTIWAGVGQVNWANDLHRSLTSG